ncbi:MAG: TIGR03862 family flavoprotein [Pseudomonadota bacterium]
MIDYLVVGGGPAGLMAADCVSAAGYKTVIIDQMPSLGRKFLMAGKSGLNLTKDEPLDLFLTRYPNIPAPLMAAITRFGPDAVQDFAKSLDQDIFTGSSGRVFPVIMKASPMLRVWLAKLSAQGVETRTRTKWLGCDGDLHRLETPSGEVTIQARTAIFAMGGGSWARLGSDGEWQEKLRALGIVTTPFKPSNSAVRVAWSPFMGKSLGKPLKAVTFSSGGVELSGEALITKDGLEGTAIYNATPALRQGARLLVDLLPQKTDKQIVDALEALPHKMSVANKLRRIGLKDEAQAVLRDCLKPLPSDWALARALKKLEIPIAQLAPIDEAISTIGGVQFENIDHTFMLKDHPGWFVAGEMADWDAPTGGYLLTACFATGRSAGEGAINYLQS